MQVLRVREKHGEYILEAEDLGLAALGILTQRWNEGYWYDEPDVEIGERKLAELEAVKAQLSEDSTLLPDTQRRIDSLERELVGERKHADWMDWAKRVVEDQVTGWPEGVSAVQLGVPGAGRHVFTPSHGPLPWLLLKYRSDQGYEYESILLEETRKPKVTA